MESHESQAGRGLIGDINGRLDFSAFGSQCHVVAVDNAQFQGVIGVNIHGAFRLQAVQNPGATAHGTGMVVLQYPAGGQGKRVIRRHGFGWRPVLDRVEFAQSAREFTGMQDWRAGVFAVATRPLQAVVVQPVELHATVDRRERRHFLIDILDALVRKRIAHFFGQHGDNLPIGSGLSGRLYSFTYPLHSSLGTRIGAVFLGEGGRRQNHIGQHGRLGGKDILHHQEFKFLERLRGMSRVRLGQGRIFTDNVHCPDIAADSGLHHLGYRRPRLVLDGAVPSFLELVTGFVIGHRLIAGQDVRQGAHIAGPLDIVLSAERTEAGAFTAHVAGKHQQVGDAFHVICARSMLGDAHTIEDAGSLGGGELARRPDDISPRHTGNFFGHFRRVFLDGLRQFLEAFGTLLDELLIVQVLFQDDVHHGVEQRDITTRFLAEVQGGLLSKRYSARVRHYQPGVAGHYCLTDITTDDRVTLGSVGADDEEKVGLFKIGDGVAHGAVSESCGRTGHCRRMSETGAVVYIIGADDGPGEFLHQVILFIGKLGRTQDTQAVRSVSCLNAQ